MIKLKKETIDKIFSYLQTKPYQEVASIINEIAAQIQEQQKVEENNKNKK